MSCVDFILCVSFCGFSMYAFMQKKKSDEQQEKLIWWMRGEGDSQMFRM